MGAEPQQPLTLTALTKHGGSLAQPNFLEGAGATETGFAAAAAVAQAHMQLAGAGGGGGQALGEDAAPQPQQVHAPSCV